LGKLDAEFGLAKVFGSTNIDFLSRFPGIIFWDRSFEALYDYYQKRVSISVDITTSVATVKVSAFNADRLLSHQ